MTFRFGEYSQVYSFIVCNYFYPFVNYQNLLVRSTHPLLHVWQPPFRANLFFPTATIINFLMICLDHLLDTRDIFLHSPGRHMLLVHLVDFCSIALGAVRKVVCETSKRKQTGAKEKPGGLIAPVGAINIDYEPIRLFHI